MYQPNPDGHGGHYVTKTIKRLSLIHILKETVDSKGMIDVGAGVEKELGISKEKLNQALYMLEREGYEVYGGGVPQVTNPGKQTNIKVLCPPGTCLLYTSMRCLLRDSSLPRMRRKF